MLKLSAHSQDALLEELDRLMTTHSDTLALTARVGVTTQLSGQIEDLEDRLRSYTTLAETCSLTKRVDECREKQILAGNDITAINTHLQTIDDCLLTKASVTQVKACVLRSHFEDIIRAVGTGAYHHHASRSVTISPPHMVIRR